MMRDELVIASDSLDQAPNLERAFHNLEFDITLIHAADALREATRALTTRPFAMVVMLPRHATATDLDALVERARPRLAVVLADYLPVAPAMRRAAHLVPSAILHRDTPPPVVAATVIALAAAMQPVTT